VCKSLNENDLQKKILEGYKNFDELMKEWGIGDECKICLLRIKLVYESMKENLNENR
jgi:bacterioferritin-associated ferredoxin